MKKKILFLSWLNYDKARDKDGNLVYKDKYLEDIYSQFSKDEIILMDCPDRLGFELKKLKEKVEREPETIDCFEAYMKFKDHFKTLKQKRLLTKRFNKLIKNKKFKDSFVYEGVNIFELVLPQFKRYFKSRLKHHLFDYNVLTRLIDMLDPSVVVSPSETEIGLLPFITVCRKKGIPTMGIQHGTMGYHTDSVHTKEEMEGYR